MTAAASVASSVTPWLPWTAVFTGSALMWWPHLRPWALGLLALGYLGAILLGWIGLWAVLSFALLGLAAWMTAAARKRPVRIGGHVLFVLTALALGAHLLPGFDNPRVIDAVRTTPDAAPFTMYLNFDKPLLGYWLLLFWPALQLHRDWSESLMTALYCAIAVAGVCLSLAFALTQVGWAPKWPSFGLLWALNNLLLVCLAEEAFFRGYLQEALQQRWAQRTWGTGAAIAIAAVLFGLVHLGAGPAWTLLVTVAGVGCGVAYRHGGLLAAVLTHFGLNLVHFAAFTYPMLA